MHLTSTKVHKYLKPYSTRHSGITRLIRLGYDPATVAALAVKTQLETPLEEAQASIRAARFAPSLSSTERYTLLRDGITRLYKAHIKIRQVKNILHINNR